MILLGEGNINYTEAKEIHLSDNIFNYNYIWFVKELTNKSIPYDVVMSFKVPPTSKLSQQYSMMRFSNGYNNLSKYFQMMYMGFQFYIPNRTLIIGNPNDFLSVYFYIDDQGIKSVSMSSYVPEITHIYGEK